MNSRRQKIFETCTHSLAFFVSLLLVSVITGCGLLDSENPGSILAEDISDVNTIPFLVNGQKNELALALDVTVIYSGLLGDELVHSGSFPTWRQMSDGNVQEDNSSGSDLWAGLQRSRFLGDDNIPRMKELLGAEAGLDVNVATTLNYTGFAYLIFGDLFERAAYDTGPEASRNESYQLAVERFTEAASIAASGNHAEQLNLANAGLARAQLMLENYAAAHAAAEQVEPAFEFFMHYDAQNSNSVFFFNHRRPEFSIGELYRDTGDPRVAVQNTGTVGGDNVTPLFLQTKYTDDVAPIRIASGMEAVLISAEALNETGEQAGAIASLNFVRNSSGLAAYDGAATYEAVRDAIRLERKYELFLEGKRLADLRRYRDEGDSESIAFFQGRVSDALPLPDTEYRTNPNVGPKTPD